MCLPLSEGDTGMNGAAAQLQRSLTAHLVAVLFFVYEKIKGHVQSF